MSRTTLHPFTPLELASCPEPGPLGYVVNGLIPKGETTTLFGDSGQGKSTVAGALALSVALGRPFLGMDSERGAVLILDWELNRDRTLERLYKLARGMGLITIPTGVYYVGLYGPLKDVKRELVDWCGANDPALVILDSYIGAAGADPLDQRAATDLFGRLRDIPAARLLIDHQANPVPGVKYVDKRAFGSAYKHHLARSAMQLQLRLSVPGKASGTLRHVKHNFGPQLSNLFFDIVYEDSETRLENTTDTAAPVSLLPASDRVEVYLAKHGASTVDDITDALGLVKKTVQNAFSTLRKGGKMPVKPEVGPSGESVYDLTR